MNLKDIFKRESTIKLSRYFEIIHPTYSVLKLKPDTSIRNYTSESIVNLMVNMYSIPLKRFSRNKFKVKYKLPFKCSFFMDISVDSIEFYLVVPVEYENITVEKCRNTWNRITITKVDSIKAFSEDTDVFEVMLKKEDSLAIKVDRKSNEPLISILGASSMLQEGDRLGVFYNFIPREQKSWRREHQRTLDKVKRNEIIYKDKVSASFIAMYILSMVGKVLEKVLEMIGEFLPGEKRLTDGLIDELATGLDNYKQLSDRTISKGDKTVVNTQIVVMSESKDSLRKRRNAESICNSFNILSEDNGFIYRKLKGQGAINYDKYKVANAKENTFTTEECTNFLKLPGRELLTEYKNIEKVDVLESSLPEDLKQGYMNIGEVTFRGHKENAYLPSDKIYGNLPITLIGPEGSGKSKFFVSQVKDAYDKGEANIVIDFIKSNDLSKDIMKIIPEKDLVVIKCDDNDSLQGLGYNELKPKSNNPYDILDYASMQTEQDIDLIDSCNAEPLSGRMLKYFCAAANVVHVHVNKNISDVIKCLENYVIRDEYIKYVESCCQEIRDDLEEDVLTLRELDEVKEIKNKETQESYFEVVGTKYGSISYIIDRIQKLKINSTLKHMYRKNCENNIDLFKAVEENKTILIQLPGIKFKDIARDVLVTYWVGKTWLISELKGDKYEGDEPPKLNVYIDELYQCKVAEKRIAKTLEQTRKFGTRYFLSCHHINQLSQLERALKSEGSYMLFFNANKDNYYALKEELDPYTLEDLSNLKEFHALCLIKYRGGYAKFVCKLPSRYANL